jgi:hypothetical protein
LFYQTKRNLSALLEKINMKLALFTKHAVKGIATTYTLRQNPFTLLVDTLTKVLITALIPIPLTPEILIYFRGPLVALFLGGILFSITLLYIMYATLFAKSPTLLFLTNILYSKRPVAQPIQALLDYNDPGFSDTDIPDKDPFGGSGVQNQTITVNYHEIESFTFAGVKMTEAEQGIDIIPSALYYQTNGAYTLTGQPIIFDTVTGTTHIYSDAFGANIIEVTNASQTIKTVFIHLSQFLVANGTNVHPGEPIGVMGSTGMSTGPHLEYQVRINKNGNWVTQNPLSYIH